MPWRDKGLSLDREEKEVTHKQMIVYKEKKNRYAPVRMKCLF